MLGSVGKDKPSLHDIFEFYAVHERWLTSNDRAMPHPTPIQGDWTIDAIGLPSAVLEKDLLAECDTDYLEVSSR